MSADISDYAAASRHRNFRNVTRHPRFIEYRRLAALVAVVNLWIFASGLTAGRYFNGSAFVTGPIAQMALFNFTLGILIRQQRVVNALFWLATRIPVSWPLWIRWGAGKVFHFGGLHSGSTVAGSVWFAFLLFAIAWNAQAGVGTSSAVTLALSAAMVGLMAAMISVWAAMTCHCSSCSTNLPI